LDPALHDVVSRMLDEAQSIAGICYRYVTRRSGAAPNHRPSLLQDYERGRPMEIDALVSAPQAFARTAALSTPTLDVLAALAICRARDRGLYVD
jgi:2-dehydropantoate 2-reductase